MKNFVLAVTMLVLIAGCANAPPDDPIEPYNRVMFSFNEKVDDVAIRPAAKAYVMVTPAPVRGWIGNFFGNLRDPWIGVNNLLQGKPAEALSDMMRFLVNSTIGLGGLLDIATEAQIPKHDEDFGQTLGVWGVKEGPFVVLPFFGPHTFRDAWALPLDTYGENPWSLRPRRPMVPSARNRYGAAGLKLINERARLLGIERTLDEGTLDKYRYMRDFYLQQRRSKVHDGDPPLEYEDFDAPDEPGDKK